MQIKDARSNDIERAGDTILLSSFYLFGTDTRNRPVVKNPRNIPEAAFDDARTGCKQ